MSLRLAGATGQSTLTRWRKRPGEAFRKGEALYDVETEKALLEVPAPCDGIMIAPKVVEGAIVQVGQVVCIIDEV